MLDKKDYNQQDIDYAFALENKEQKKEEGDNTVIENTMFENNGASASTTYQMLILQKIFGGIKTVFRGAGNRMRWTVCRKISSIVLTKSRMR